MSTTSGLQPQPFRQDVFAPSNARDENTQPITFHCVCECLKVIVDKIVQFCKWVWNKIVNLCKNLAGGSTHQRITLETLSQNGILSTNLAQPDQQSNHAIFLDTIGLSLRRILGAEKTNLIQSAQANENWQMPVELNTNELDKLRRAPLIAFRLADWLSREGQSEDYLRFEPQTLHIYLSDDQNERFLLSTTHATLFNIEERLNFYNDLKDQLIEQFPSILTENNTEGIIEENANHIVEFFDEESE